MKLVLVKFRGKPLVCEVENYVGQGKCVSDFDHS